MGALLCESSEDEQALILKTWKLSTAILKGDFEDLQKPTTSP